MPSSGTIVYPQNEVTKITLQVNTDQDNVWYYGEEGWRFGGSHYIGCDQPDYQQESVAYRWTSVNIPKQALISSAHIIMYGRDYTGSAFDEKLVIYGFFDTHPFTTRPDLEARVRTQQEVDWVPNAWGGTEGWHNTTNISAVIQEIINQDSWDYNGTIVLTINSAIKNKDMDKTLYSYAQNPEYVSKLEIEYTQVETYTINTIVNGEGSIIKNPNHQAYPQGSQVELYAVPDNGWTFSGWSGDLTGSTNPRTIIMDGDKTVTAIFTQDEYTLAVNTVGGGSVTRNPDQATYPHGTVVKLTAVADSGWDFLEWSGDLTGSTNPETITVGGSKTVTATFAQDEYTLTVNIVGSGSVTKNPDKVSYHFGDVVTLTAVPDSGWKFSWWSGGVSGTENPVSIAIDDNFAIYASFEEVAEDHVITASAGTGGSIDPSGTVLVHHGYDQTFSITPDTGYRIDDVLVDGSSVGAMGSYKFMSVTSDHSITAIFERDYANYVFVTVDKDDVIGTNRMSIGFQLDFEWNSWRTRLAQRTLSSDAGFKLIRIDDFRNQNPDLGPCTSWDSSTSTGVFDWTYVDDLVSKIFSVGAEPLVALGWAREPTTYVPPGMTLINNLPDPNDWAAYCGEWVTHFKNRGVPVRFYEVTNEPWAYFGWNDQPELDNFLDVFSAARTKMRTINPDVLVSFDGTNRKPVLDYILSDGHRVDFISFHKYDSSTIGEFTDAEMFYRAETVYFNTSPSYYGVEDARQRYYNVRGVLLPVLITEYNFNSGSSQGTDPKIQQLAGSVWSALVLRASILNDVDYCVYYSWASSPSWESTKPSGGLGFGMIDMDDNMAWYPYYVNEFIGSRLGRGDQLVSCSSSSGDISCLAWKHGGSLKMLLISKVGASRKIIVDGFGDSTYSKIDESISYLTPQVQHGSISQSDYIVTQGYCVLLVEET
jgi:uncharacterized repeat protein (TIGR02543 family)